MYARNDSFSVNYITIAVTWRVFLIEMSTSRARRVLSLVSATLFASIFVSWAF